MTENVPAQLEGDPLPDTGPTLLSVYGTPRFYGNALYDERGRTTFIKAVVSLCRKSPEMARYRAFLTENLDMGHCAIFSNLSDEECLNAGVELHHWPFSLFDICAVVLGQMEYNEERITTFAVAHRVMALHWRGMVGLVPLVKTMHELAHAGQLRLDPRWAFGNWQGLIREHSAGLSEGLIDRLEAEFGFLNREDVSESNARLLEVRPQRWNAVPVTVERLLAGPETEEDA
jgi:hypothetical protein